MLQFSKNLSWHLRKTYTTDYRLLIIARNRDIQEKPKSTTNSMDKPRNLHQIFIKNGNGKGNGNKKR